MLQGLRHQSIYRNLKIIIVRPQFIAVIRSNKSGGGI